MLGHRDHIKYANGSGNDAFARQSRSELSVLLIFAFVGLLVFGLLASWLLPSWTTFGAIFGAFIGIGVGVFYNQRSAALHRRRTTQDQRERAALREAETQRQIDQMKRQRSWGTR